MSTTGIDSWAVDLADIAAIYPFQGTEILMTFIAVAGWIYWHVAQMKAENKENKKNVERYKQKLDKIITSRKQ